MTMKARTQGETVELKNGQHCEITHIENGVIYLETLETFSVDGYDDLEAPKEYSVPVELFSELQA